MHTYLVTSAHDDGRWLEVELPETGPVTSGEAMRDVLHTLLTEQPMDFASMTTLTIRRHNVPPC